MTRPLRVFHIIKSLGRGGAEVLLPEGLRCADRELFVFRYGYFLPWKDALVASLREQDVEVTCFEAHTNAAMLLTARRLADQLVRWNTDLLHCHMPMAGVVGRLAGRLARVPVVYTEHNKMERFHPLTRRLNLATWRWQKQVIAVSRDVADSIRQHAGARVPVKVVLNGVDIDAFSRERIDGGGVRHRFGIPCASPVVGTVAVFRPQKRLQDWLEAARRIHERRPDVHFLLVGDGPLRQEVRGQCATLGLEHVVHFPGLQEDVREYLAAMDLYMSSSIVEGLPIALLEAMSMSCTVVCTAVGGIPEVVHDHENGFLVTPRRPEALAEVVCEILASPDSRQRTAAKARQTIVEGFSILRMTRQIEGTYVDVLNGTHYDG